MIVASYQELYIDMYSQDLCLFAANPNRNVIRSYGNLIRTEKTYKKLTVLE